MPDPRRNHSLLYLLLPGGEPGEYEWVAESNGIFPSLWQFLFATGRLASDDALRVLEGRVTHGISVDAHAALGRFQCVVDFLRGSPVLHDVPGLRLYLDGAVQHLRHLTASWTFADIARPLLCASFDEFARPKTQSLDQCAREHLDLCSRQWQAMERLTQRGDFDSLQDVLRFAELHLRLQDWKAWAGVFGLALFKHPYFANAFRHPYAQDYEDFDYDPLGSSADLDRDHYRFKENGLWGVCRRTATGEIPLFNPEWDRILKAEAEPTDLIWLRRGARFGLAQLSTATLLLEPSLDEVREFRQDLAIARVESKMGFLARNGHWHLAPHWDEVREYHNRRAAVVVDHRLGFIDRRGNPVIIPRFDQADDFNSEGIARVRVGSRYQLIRTDGSVAIEGDRIEWSERFSGWLCGHAPSVSLLHADASRWIDGDWDALDPCVPQDSILARRGQHCGLLHWSGNALLACEYQELLPRAQQPDQLIAHRSGRVGVLTQDGEPLLPFDFSSIEELEPHVEAHQTLATPHLLRVRSAPGQAKPKVGLWDLQQRQLLVPCRYDFIWSTWLGREDDYGFIVISKLYTAPATRQFRVGILRADGSTLVPQDFAWIAGRIEPTRANAITRLRSSLYFSWSRGNPVRAALRDEAHVVWLHADASLTHDGSVATVHR